MYATKLGSMVSKIVEESSKVLVNRERDVTMIVLAIVADGHVLIEGVPGIAKTLTAKVVARLTNLSFARVQCTLDILPADIIGTKIYNQKTGDFEVRLGPIFTNILLVDEINRAPPRTQSALLEAMQEKQVTIEGETIKLPTPFTVIATQNPIEMEGVFPLPEAQLDRFFIKIEMDMLSRDPLIALLKRGEKNIIREFNGLKPVVNSGDIVEASNEIETVYADDSVLEYIARIVEYSHRHPALKLGISARGALHLLTLSKEFALLDNRKYLIPDDVKNAAMYALPHRLFIKSEYLAEGYRGRSVVADILNKVEVPKP